MLQWLTWHLSSTYYARHCFMGGIYKTILFSQVPYEVASIIIHIFHIRILRHREVNTFSLVTHPLRSLKRCIWLNLQDLLWCGPWSPWEPVFPSSQILNVTLPTCFSSLNKKYPLKFITISSSQSALIILENAKGSLHWPFFVLTPFPMFSSKYPIVFSVTEPINWTISYLFISSEVKNCHLLYIRLHNSSIVQCHW